jgi:hypothetical protein
MRIRKTRHSPRTTVHVRCASSLSRESLLILTRHHQLRAKCRRSSAVIESFVAVCSRTVKRALLDPRQGESPPRASSSTESSLSPRTRRPSSRIRSTIATRLPDFAAAIAARCPPRDRCRSPPNRNREVAMKLLFAYEFENCTDPQR